MHDIKSQIGKLTRQEKNAIRGGDKSVLYEKLGLLEEKDLKAYYAKYGMKGSEATSAEDLEEELLGRTKLGKRKSRSRF